MVFAEEVGIEQIGIERTTYSFNAILCYRMRCLRPRKLLSGSWRRLLLKFQGYGADMPRVPGAAVWYDVIEMITYLFCPNRSTLRTKVSW